MFLGPAEHVRWTDDSADVVQHAGQTALPFVQPEATRQRGAFVRDRLHMRKGFGPAVGQQEIFRGQHLGQMNVVKGFQHNMS